MTYKGTVYRAINPLWSSSPLSGKGAALYGGRFNPKGMPALYTSMDMLTAIFEASLLGRPFQPLTLISYNVECLVFDACNPESLEQMGFTMEDLSNSNWILDMDDGSVPPQHKFAKKVINEGFDVLRVPSFASGSGMANINLVFWKWGTRETKINVVDDEVRLPPTG